MIEIKHVSYTYPSGGNNSSLKDFSLQISRGECVVLCGKSGCGKTTVTRLLNGLIPHFYEGTLTGWVTIDGQEVAKTELSQMAKMVGSVFQNPKSQFFNVDTDGEMAFGCENMALSKKEIARNVQKATCGLALQGLLGRNIFHLSGGEKQQVACGSVYATNPPVYVLDEPSSNMDVQAVERLKRILKTLKDEGKTVVISEHRLYYLMALADRFVYLQDGKLAQVFSPPVMAGMSKRQLEDLGLRMPSQSCVSYTGSPKRSNRPQGEANPAIRIEALRCLRGKQEVLFIPYLEIPSHAVIALIGENGAGKSSLVEVLCGFLKHKGRIFFAGRTINKSKRAQSSYMVMQDVNRQLFCASVLQEVALGLPLKQKESAERILKTMELDVYKDRHPASLSGGQKQRVAICAATGTEKTYMYYDEPTSGLDFEGMNRLCRLIRKNAEKTLSTFVITHDFELVMGCCTHVLHLDKGRVAGFYPLDSSGILAVKDYFVR